MNREQDDNVKAMVEKRRDVDAMKIDKWNEFCRLHPRVLQPAFKLQQEMQASHLSVKMCTASLFGPVDYCRLVY